MVAILFSVWNINKGPIQWASGWNMFRRDPTNHLTQMPAPNIPYSLKWFLGLFSDFATSLLLNSHFPSAYGLKSHDRWPERSVSKSNKIEHFKRVPVIFELFCCLKIIRSWDIWILGGGALLTEEIYPSPQIKVKSSKEYIMHLMHDSRKGCEYFRMKDRLSYYL